MKIHLGMPPMKTVRGEQWACYQLLKGRRAVGAVLFCAWNAIDIRVQSLRLRAVTYDGIADAMAEQWGNYLRATQVSSST